MKGMENAIRGKKCLFYKLHRSVTIARRCNCNASTFLFEDKNDITETCIAYLGRQDMEMGQLKAGGEQWGNIS